MTNKVTVQWSSARLEAFRAEVTRARAMRKAVSDTYGWDENLARYVPLPELTETGGRAYRVNVGADFRDVERKKAALFYDTPTVSFVTDDPSLPLGPAPPVGPDGQPAGPPPPSMGDVVAIHNRFVNALLGARYAGAKRVVLKALFDVLCPAGIGPVQVGFDATTVPVDQPVMDPMTGQPSGQVQSVDVPIHQEFWWAHLSPKALLIPADHRDTDINLAPWVGYDFTLPISEARRRFGLPDDWRPSGGELIDKPYFEDESMAGQAGSRSSASDPEVSGFYVEYRMHAQRQPGEAQVHPQHIAILVCLDGHPLPIEHRPSPHQTIGPDARLTPDSLTQFTIQPLALRDLSDKAWVPSDSTVTGPLTKELNRYRSVTVQQRDGNRIIMLYDPDKLNPEARDKVQRGEIGMWVPVEPGQLDQGVNTIMQPVTQLSQGRENWTGQDYLERDREQILGIGANQTGVPGRTTRTATEISTVQRNSEARFKQEQQRVFEWYLGLVCQFDTLVLRYADAALASRVLGPQAGQLWAQTKQALAGAYTYEIQIDTGKYLDAEANRRQWLQLINLTGQSPHVNNVPILKRLVASYGLKPSEVVIDQPPKASPPPPKVSITIQADQFNPALPQFPIVLELARQGGFDISDQAVQNAQEQAQRQAMVAAAVTAKADTPVPPDPPQITGTLPQMPRLNQKQMDESGQPPGPGALM